MDTSFFHTLAALALQPWVLLIFAVALVFDFINGFHDAANAIATVVGTRVLRPGAAVLWAAFWCFSAALGVGMAVANTVAKFVHAEWVTPEVIFAGLMGAILWGLITWFFGLPTSSSHALLGGFSGAAIAHAGKLTGVVHMEKFLTTVAFIVIAPLIGFALGFLLVVLVIRIFWRTAPGKIDRHFRIVQLFSSAAYSFGFGTNDAQKTMGIIALGLMATGHMATFSIPLWVILASAVAMGAGTLFGGWSLIRTLGAGFYRLRPVHGFSAQMASSAVILGAALMGGPVSTTHVVSSAIVGAGSAERVQKVRWGVVNQIVVSWFLTIPAAAALGALLYAIIRPIF